MQGQVICVTHQPQVAAKGHQHLRVSKQVVGDKTLTDVTALSGESKIDEIARMLGGINVTKKTIDHAKEMRRCIELCLEEFGHRLKLELARFEVCCPFMRMFRLVTLMCLNGQW